MINQPLYDRVFSARALFCMLVLCTGFLSAPYVAAQQPAERLDRVMTLTWDTGDPTSLAVDEGAAGLWQKLLKLQTTASVLHTVAHPDDEQAGVLAYLSRGRGARVAQLTLNRGEGGANAIGSELFDELGLVRTEELLLAGTYYGLDDLYFTTMIDYGFSKTLDEALRNWGRENILRDVVRIIRINRPFVILSRFHGSERDGHGHHQAAGVISQAAFRLAGDPNAFPEQIEAGLRPWQPLKLYRGGVRENETWHVKIDPGKYSPWLGTSYRNFAMYGRSLQRSQTSGRYRKSMGADPQYYERMYSTVESSEKEAGLFAGIDTSLPGLFSTLGETPPPGALDLLTAVQQHVEDAIAAFNMQQPSAVVPSLVLGLEKTRRAIDLVAHQPDVRFYLRLKERQFVDAINTALGLRFSVVSVPGASSSSDSPWAPLATMGPVVPGQSFRVETALVNPSPLPIEPQEIFLMASEDWHGGESAEAPAMIRSTPLNGDEVLQSQEHVSATFDLTVPEQAEFSRRYYYRDDIRESRYKVRDSTYLHLPSRRPPLVAVARYLVDGVPVEIRASVRRREANFPYGYEMHTLKIVPAIAVNVSPQMRIVPTGQGQQSFDLQVQLLNNHDGPISGELRVEAPSEWQVEPVRQPFKFSRGGQKRNYTITVSIPDLEQQDYTVQVVATANGKEYRQGYRIISHRDNGTNYLFRPAVTHVRGIDVEIAPDLQVGYVMGVGDKVPAGIEQLGADVSLLTTEDLATGRLSQYDAIVVGTRAYAVRQDLLTYNQRLLDFARQGGNLIVLYQTPEFVPRKMAPYPANLPARPEEVSEEDAPVTILAEDHPAFNWPNEITLADFDGWVEQRGSKFFSTWDSAYVPMIETHDQGQEPQRGGWLTAQYGDGYYTYFAYAIHRQMPYAVPGAYRIFANLLSLGEQ